MRARTRNEKGGRLLKLCLKLQVVITFSLIGFPLAPIAAEEDVDIGRKIYELRCMHCHGSEGKGDGVAASFLSPKPRDFTRGQFKIRSTLSGFLPTDDDLLTTVSEGMPGTSMPAWKDVLSKKEREEVVTYIKTFSIRFERETDPPEMVQLGDPIAPTAESIAKGRQLFDDLECWKCHGKAGRGDGPSAPTLVDEWEIPTRPTDLTRPWNFRAGGKDEDVYKTFVSGFAGTPMPSYAEVFETPEEAREMNWHLVNYMSTLAPERERPEVKSVIVPMQIDGDIPIEPGDSLWSRAEPYSFTLVGQIIEKPRWFTPSIDLISVRALRNEEEIGFLLEWHDGTDSETGKPMEPDSVTNTDVAMTDSVVASKKIQEYPDAIALQFPLQIPSGSVKPYFLMGDPRRPVNLWTWSSWRRSTVTEAIAKGMDEVIPETESTVQGHGESELGRYRVVMKRSLSTDDESKCVQFEEGRFIPIAFHAWDGARGETGKQHAVSSWYLLYLEAPRPLRVALVPPVLVIIAVGTEVWFVRKIRKNGRS